jgi:pyridoxine 5-phosphate synthase
MTKLSVNLNKFALIRNSRDIDNPNVRGMAIRAMQAGAHGITVHPRPDQRHARYSDVEELAALIDSNPDVEFNVEGNPGIDFLEIVARTRPDQCTLVPDAPDQLTSDHGWNLVADSGNAKPIVNQLQKLGIRVSLFLDPVAEQIELAGAIGADRVEFYTEPYARVFGTDAEDEVWSRFATAASHATSIGLGVNAGHDLNLANLSRFLTIPDILEVSIGHAIVVESFDYGFEDTVRRYLEIVS